MSAVAAAARLAVANARLQAELRERVAEVEASRRRIVAAADEQRRRLEEELRVGDGAGRSTRVAELVGRIDPELEREVAAARVELAEFALGIHPAALTDRGLAEAIRELAERASLPRVACTLEQADPGPGRRGGRVLRLLEALANVAKHAHASQASVR